MKTKLNLLFLALCPLFSFAQTKAVSVYERGSVFVAPDRTSTPVGTIRFGVDVVEMTLETIIQDKTTFVKVILGDGTTGYVSKYLLVPNGEGAVIAQNTGIFQNPVDNVTMVRNKEFTAGEPVVFTELSGPYAYVVGQEKKKEGWVLVANLLTGNDEVRGATMYAAALRENNVEKRLKALKHLKAQSANLKIAPLINLAYEDVQSASANGYVDMTGLTPSTSEPMASADMSRDLSAPRGAGGFTGKSKGATQPNAKVSQPTTTNDKSVKHVETLPIIIVTDDAAKPFSCYHKTLPVGTKVAIRIPDNAGFMEFEVVGRLQSYEGIGMTEKSLKRVLGDEYPDTATVEYYTK